jgi:hypothetical protein
VACVRLGAEGTVQAEVRTLDMTTLRLLALADWLRGCLETIRRGLKPESSRESKRSPIPGASDVDPRNPGRS